MIIYQGGTNDILAPPTRGDMQRNILALKQRALEAGCRVYPRLRQSKGFRKHLRRAGLKQPKGSLRPS